MNLSALRKCAFVLPAAALALALAGCKAEGGPEAPAKAQKAGWTPAAKVETMPAKAELPPGESRAFAVGDKSVWKQSDGKELSWKTVKLDGSIMEVHGSNGCKAAVQWPTYSPTLAWRGCSGSAGSQKIEKHAGGLFPLAVGNTESWTFSGRNDRGNTWSGARNCKVAGTANVTVPAGTFDAYHVVCREHSARYDYWFLARIGQHGHILQGAAAGQEELPLPPRTHPSGTGGLTAPRLHRKAAKPRRVASGVFRSRFPFRRRQYIGAADPRPSPGGERHVRPAGRPAHRGGLGLRGGAARRHGARPARRRRDPLRCAGRRARLPALAGNGQGRQHLLGRPQQGQAVLPASISAARAGANWCRR